RGPGRPTAERSGNQDRRREAYAAREDLDAARRPAAGGARWKCAALRPWRREVPNPPPGRSALHAADGDSLDEEALREDEQDDDGKDDERRRGHQRVVAAVVLTGDEHE